MIYGGKGKTFFHEKKSFSLSPIPPFLFQKKRGIAAPLSRHSIKTSQIITRETNVSHLRSSEHHADNAIAGNSKNKNIKMILFDPFNNKNTMNFRINCCYFPFIGIYYLLNQSGNVF